VTSCNFEPALSANAGTLINHHRRQQAGLRVSSCGAESTINCLIITV